MLKNQTVRLENRESEDYFFIKLGNGLSIMAFHMVSFVACLCIFGLFKGLLIHYAGSAIMTFNLFLEVYIQETEFTKPYIKNICILIWSISLIVSMFIYCYMFIKGAY